MSNLWTLWPAQRLIFGAFGLVLSAVAFAAEPASTLSVDTVVTAFRSKNGLSTYKTTRTELADAQIKASAGGFQEAPNLSMEVETAPRLSKSNDQDAPPPRGFEGGVKAVVSRELVFGVDSAQTTARFSAQAEADVLEKAAELGEEEREIVASFLSLKREARVFAELTASKSKAEKFVSLSRKAARMGTLGGLAATQAEIFLDQITNDIEQSRLTFAAEADRLTASTGLPIAAIETISFADAPAVSDDNSSVATSPQVAAIERRRSALELERESLLSRRTMELGLGVSRSWGETPGTSVIGEITLPLGVGAAKRSEAQALNAERAAIQAEGELLKAKIARELARIEAEIKRLSGATSRLRGRVERLSSLFNKTESAFTRGQGEVSEVIATLSELIDARLEAIRTSVELESAQMSRKYLLRPFAG